MTIVAKLPLGAFPMSAFIPGRAIGAPLTGADVVRVARSFVGVRYVHQGRSRDGVDCIGLPRCVRDELGLPLLDAEPGYTRTSHSSEMLDFCRRNLLAINLANAAPGDLLVQVNGRLRHMAIVGNYPGGGLSLIHAFLPNRKVIECRIGDDFMQLVRGCFRFPEVMA